MKKPLLLVLMFLGFLLMFSCNKYEYEKIDLPELSVAAEVESYFQIDGTEENDMDVILYEITKVFEKEILSPINIEKYKELFKEYKEVHLSRILKTTDLEELRILERGLKVGDSKYVASLMIPNIEVADFSLNPIIAPGGEIDYENNDLSGNIIVGWYYNDREEKKIIYLDENIGTTITRPVIIVSNDNQTEAKVSNEVGTAYTKKFTTTDSYLHTFPIVDVIKIKVSYEWPGREDVNFAFQATRYVGGLAGNFNVKLKDVAENDFFQWIEVEGITQSALHVITSIEKIYMVMYEKDWNRTYKDIIFQDGHIGFDMCKMKNNGDWYVITYAKYDEEGYLEYLYDAYGNIVFNNKGSIEFAWT